MRLNTIRVHHFRQFYGTTPAIACRPSGPHRTTVLFGENGGGKTSLLNALTWCLYGRFSRAVQESIDAQDTVAGIVNNRAVREAKPNDRVECWVEVTFDHQGNGGNQITYMVKRSFFVVRGTDPQMRTAEDDKGRGRLEVYRDSTFLTRDEAPGVIDSILPEILARYFFFDGERLEHILAPDKKEQKQTDAATQRLLGIANLLAVRKHVHKAAATIERQMKGHSDGTEKGLYEQKESEEQRYSRAKEQLDYEEVNLEGFKTAIDTARADLRRCQAVEHLTKERDDLQRQLEDATREQDAQHKQTREALASQGYLVFLAPAVKTVQDLIEKLRQRGQLPNGLQQQFVDDLLTKGTCICGQNLVPGTPHHTEVMVWRDRAGLGKIEEKTIELGAQVSNICQDAERFLADLDLRQQRKGELKRRIGDLEKSRQVVDDQLFGSDVDQAKQLARKIVELENGQRSCYELIGIHKRAMTEAEQQIEVVQQDLKRHESRSEDQRRLKRQLLLANDTFAAVSKIQDIYEQTFRRRLESHTRTSFRAICTKEYDSFLDEDYVPKLRNAQGELISPSQGEALAHAACFLTAIVSVRKEDSQIRDQDPSLPVVMDSPFGNLGPIFRRQVADMISDSADQTVLMVSASQWQGEVSDVLTPRLANAYRIVSHSTEARNGLPKVLFQGKSLPLWAVSDSADDYSTIEPIELDHV